MAPNTTHRWLQRWTWKPRAPQTRPCLGLTSRRTPRGLRGFSLELRLFRSLLPGWRPEATGKPRPRQWRLFRRLACPVSPGSGQTAIGVRLALQPLQPGAVAPRRCSPPRYDSAPGRAAFSREAPGGGCGRRRRGTPQLARTHNLPAHRGDRAAETDILLHRSTWAQDPREPKRRRTYNTLPPPSPGAQKGPATAQASGPCPRLPQATPQPACHLPEHQLRSRLARPSWGGQCLRLPSPLQSLGPRNTQIPAADQVSPPESGDPGGQSQ
mmetsp:Transcript_16130/g.41096  ORF Transcript_16130/g.41096 Transcript_16130/m.41096 type:complete len:269 (+) Transcript_16130:286-1092(+)